MKRKKQQYPYRCTPHCQATAHVKSEQRISSQLKNTVIVLEQRYRSLKDKLDLFNSTRTAWKFKFVAEQNKQKRKINIKLRELQSANDIQRDIIVRLQIENDLLVKNNKSLMNIAKTPTLDSSYVDHSPGDVPDDELLQDGQEWQLAEDAWNAKHENL